MIEDYILGLLPADLFPFATIGDLPGTQKNEICLMLYDGVTNTEYFGQRHESTVYRPIIKFVVRNNSYEQGKGWTEQIKESLHRYSDKGAGVKGPILGIWLVGFPMYLGRNLQKMHEFQVTFSIQERSDKLG